MKSAALIVVALFIDGVQAALSAAVFIIFAFPGTILGATTGCLAGKAVAGDVGCNVGGFLLGLLGSIPLINGALATVTMPVGIILGIAISICLSFTLGAGLITLLFLNGMFYPKYLLPGGVAELIPGFGLIPAWTALVILSVIEHNKKKAGTVAATPPGVPTSNAEQKVGVPARPVDGIRTPVAANDNRVPSVQRYAA